MSLIQIDILDWIPETLRQQILDGCVDFLATRLHGVKEGKLSQTITQFRSDHTLQTAINDELVKLSPVNRNEDRFSFLKMTRVFAVAKMEKDHTRCLYFVRRWLD